MFAACSNVSNASERKETVQPLPWNLALPTIGGISLAIWLGLWRVVRLLAD